MPDARGRRSPVATVWPTLYVDAALYFNLVTASPGAYGFTDVTSVSRSISIT